MRGRMYDVVRFVSKLVAFAITFPLYGEGQKRKSKAGKERNSLLRNTQREGFENLDLLQRLGSELMASSNL
eukprot:6485122-Amphidinium_carterae.2